MKDGLDMSAIREIRALKELHHPNIIELIEVYMQRDNLNLILEFLDADLEMIIKEQSLVFMPSDIKSWMLMTLRGLAHCHSNWILHRDLKPNNLLLASNGLLKLADFGLAREYGDPQPMSYQVVTRWYRSPELLFGARHYSEGVDMWAVGCIFAELMLRTPFLAGDNDLHQIETTFKAMGTPNEQIWPGMKKLPHFLEFTVFPKTPLRALFTAASSEALDLLEKMLIYDPTKRISALDALRHKYFSESPHPTSPEKLPKPTPIPKAEDRSPSPPSKIQKSNHSPAKDA
ncbi:TFIIH complex serine/threonine-protein kinase subunit kin28 [Entomophthora muscae]|uniref:TFIIH complex serine/threonine-protein kinase subunit kin28 n=1 Tax=Entomophthora muscae TaxID=34485 RepID=A0ACC2TF51_9FUNG|nr:TFIIH complex serine/threonine-protein kinase subunit kin28 [Entomophthora muscae]